MSEHEPQATPQQQEAVRRLLAEARHDEPVPAEVAARLDGVLAQLGAEGPRAVDPPPPAPHDAVVVDLAARRRRRVTGLLGAAAAVVVLGVGVSQVVDTTSSNDDAGAGLSGRPSAAQDEKRAEGAAPESFSGAGSDATSEVPEPVLPNAGPQEPPARVPPISRRSFGVSVLRLRGTAVVPSTDQGRLSGDDLTSAPMFVCSSALFGEGRLLAVRYGGTPAVLAYRLPTGETQTVDLLQCGTATVVRSKVIAFP